MTFFNGRRDRLDAFREGDRRTLTEVFHAYANDVSLMLRRGFRLERQQVAVRGVGDVEREKDLLQEVFLRAFSERARLAFNPLLPYRPYLLQIARNLLIDEARRQEGFRLAEVTQEELELAPSLELGADEELEWRKLKEATAEYCRSLSPELREFVRLRFETGLSQRDVASQLGVTRRKVRTWEATVQDGLRTVLEKRQLTQTEDSFGPDS